MGKDRSWRLFPRQSRRVTLAEKLSGRMDAFFDACESAILNPDGGKPLGPHASRLAFAWLGDADWIRHAKYHQMQAVMSTQQVFSPSALSGDALTRMASLTAPYVMDDREFADLLNAVPQARQKELRHQRQTWRDAMVAPPSPVRKGEAASAALARFHKGPSLEESYELGRQALKRGRVSAAPPYHFLAPYAIARIHALAGIGPADPAAAPAFDQLAEWDVYSAGLVHTALTCGLGMLDVMADLPGDHESYATQELAMRLKLLQNGACLHMIGAPMPSPLPMGKPVKDLSALSDMCNEATLLARHCQLMGPM